MEGIDFRLKKKSATTEFPVNLELIIFILTRMINWKWV